MSETTSEEIASIAARGLAGEALTEDEIRRVCGSALTQREVKLEPELPEDIKFDIRQDKEFRVLIDGIIQLVKASGPSREKSLTITKLQEAVMWLGMDLKRLGAPNPYPNSYKPENAIVEPTADGLKL